jgi:hypothetical protein
MVKIADASINRFGNKSPKARESPSEEPLFDIPKPISIIDVIELDEEIQLDRERLEEDWHRIEAAWESYILRATWPQLLPCLDFKIEKYWHLNYYAAEFLKHLVFTGEIGHMEAAGLACTLESEFKTAWDLGGSWLHEYIARGLDRNPVFRGAL